jgi:hypothetical protein
VHNGVDEKTGMLLTVRERAGDRNRVELRAVGTVSGIAVAILELDANSDEFAVTLLRSLSEALAARAGRIVRPIG